MGVSTLLYSDEGGVGCAEEVEPWCGEVGGPGGVEGVEVVECRVLRWY